MRRIIVLLTYQNAIWPGFIGPESTDADVVPGVLHDQIQSRNERCGSAEQALSNVVQDTVDGDARLPRPRIAFKARQER